MDSAHGRVYRVRVVGSIAITAAYVAAGRFDAMLSLRPCRSVDAAAAQLIVARGRRVRELRRCPPRGGRRSASAARYPIAAAAGASGLAIASSAL